MKFVAIIFAFAALGAWDKGDFGSACICAVIAFFMFWGSGSPPKWRLKGVAGIYEREK